MSTSSGAGNIADTSINTSTRQDADIIPEAAIRNSTEQDFHTGRGGAGNEHLSIDHEKKAAEKARREGAPISLADKLKGKLFGGMKK
jgi:hypothetical protein